MLEVCCYFLLVLMKYCKSNLADVGLTKINISKAQMYAPTSFCVYWQYLIPKVYPPRFNV